MKKIIITFFSIVTLIALSPVFGKVRVDSVKYKSKSKNEAQVLIGYKGDLKTTPELLVVRDNIVQVSVEDAEVWPTIEKKISVAGKRFDTTIKAYQFNKGVVRFRAELPYSIKGHEGKVNITLKKGVIDLQFPRLKAKTKKPMFAAMKKKAKIDSYDESYLDILLKGKEEKNFKKREIPGAIKLKKNTKEAKVDEDHIRTTLAGNQKEKKSSQFSIANYVGKFVVFLGGMLLVFYVVVNFFKKGVLKKGKLGFLNDTKVVSVLNTTYIAPKKSLIMVKVHNQIMLLGSDDKGLHFISEVRDTAGLIKEGERSISGNNFDTSLETVKDSNKEFKLKEVPTKTDGHGAALSEFLNENPVQDKIKLSDQIKNKVKDLKQLQ